MHSSVLTFISCLRTHSTFHDMNTYLSVAIIHGTYSCREMSNVFVKMK